MSSPQLLSTGSVLVLSLANLLKRIDAELVVRAGDDGHLYLSHRFTTDVSVARIRLDGDEPIVEELSQFPGFWRNER
jgi:hypothetical protein